MFARHPYSYVYLMGDSIFRGFGFDRFHDTFANSNSLYKLTSQAKIANLILQENNLPYLFYHNGPSFGGGTYANLDNAVVSLDADRVINSIDWIIYENAGPHGGNATTFRADVDAALVAAKATGANVAICNMFDYPPAPIDSQYDLNVGGGATMNLALAAEAAEQGVPVIDLNTKMDAWVNATTDVVFINPDGIHPYFWGDLVMVRAEFEQIGIWGRVASWTQLEDLVEANFASLAFGAANFTAQKAVDGLNDIFGA